MASRKETSSDHQTTEYGDQRIERGVGGEIHQVVAGNAPRLTTQQGIVVSDDQNTPAGRRARTGRAGGFPFPGEDLPLRP